MLWIFAILGLVSLMSALYGVSATWNRGGRMLAMHILALALLGVAWAAEHTTTSGWVALGAGAAVELVDWWLWLFSRRVRGGAMPPVLARTAVATAERGRLRPAEPRTAIAEAPPMPSASKAVVPIASDVVTGEGEEKPAEAVRDDPVVPAPALPLPEPAEEEPVSEPPAELLGEPAQDEDEEPASGCEESAPMEADSIEPVADLTDEPPSAEEPAPPQNDDPTALIETASIEAPAEPPAPLPIPSISTIVFLGRKCDVAPGVFYASLRRSGQRDALMVEAPGADGETWIQAGRVMLKLCAKAIPCDPLVLEESLAATSDWPESAAITSGHEAHVVLVSEYAEETPRHEVVRLLHRAHAALAEFAPVVAVLWPDAGRLVGADDLPNLLVWAADLDLPMAETCVQFRTIALSEPNDGLFLSDSVGLHGLGLPDIQFITVGEPRDTIRKTLHGLAERFLTVGCDLVDGSAFDTGDGEAWRVTHARGAFPPDRQVIQITVKR